MDVYRISAGVEVGQQLGHDEIFRVVDHEHHDRLGHQIARRLGNNLHVGIHQIADRLHLALQLRIHRGIGGGALIAVRRVRHLLRVDAGPQEGRLPRLDVILRLAAHIQLFVILCNKEMCKSTQHSTAQSTAEKDQSIVTL